MGLFSRLRRQRAQPFAAKTDEERIARYLYLLGSLPASVIESAHATAFADLPAARRRELFEQLRPFMADGERTSPDDDPVVLARLVRRAEEHRASRRAQAEATATTAVDERDAWDPRTALTGVGAMAIVANQVLLSSAIAVYFTHGAGSLSIATEPAWVGATYDPVGTGWDAAGAGSLEGGFDGIGGGGFDAGGLGGFGGFDGGGG